MHGDRGRDTTFPAVFHRGLHMAQRVSKVVSLLIALFAILSGAPARAHEFKLDAVINAFVTAEPGEAHLVVRAPLYLFKSAKVPGKWRRSRRSAVGARRRARACRAPAGRRALRGWAKADCVECESAGCRCRRTGRSRAMTKPFGTFQSRSRPTRGSISTRATSTHTSPIRCRRRVRNWPFVRRLRRSLATRSSSPFATTRSRARAAR